MILILSTIFLAILYWYHTRTFKYWEEKGVKHDKPVIFFGTNSKGYLLQSSTAQAVADAYWKYPNEKVVGFYRASQPELIIRDPDIIKKVLVRDFYSFFCRGMHPNKEAIEPIMQNLFMVEGDLWKMLRTSMTPAFTSAKLKAMFPLITERAEKLQARTLDAAKSGKYLDARDLMARYNTDFIGACAFGLDSDSLNEEDSAFRKLGRRVFEAGVKEYLTAVLKQMYPVAFKGLKYFGKIENEAKQLVAEIKKARNCIPSGRNDYLDMMLEIKNKGAIEFESIEKMKPDGTSEWTVVNFTDDIFLGQIMLFFAAGFETSSNSTSMALHLLAYHSEEQEKVQEDIDKALAKYGNKFCYDAIKEMAYLEMAFKEAMRIFPPFGYITRGTSKKYKFEDIDLTIDKGIKVVIPVQALHMDPQYWDRPEEFKPERFLSHEAEKTKDVYMPFGNGPRNCIGSRLGLMLSLAGLAAILSKFTVRPAPQSVRHPKVLPVPGIVQSIAGGLPLIFDERK